MIRINHTIQHSDRNYSLDFLKFILTLLVFWFHTIGFVGENTRITIPKSLGFWCVHAFFIISGMLMVSSFYKRAKFDNEKNPVQQTVDYIKQWIKRISYEYYAAWLLGFVVFEIYRYNYASNPLWIRDLVVSIPELLFLPLSGVWRGDSIYINGATWYISAMLFVMIFLYYLLSRNPDFFCKFFAPIGALLSYAYMIHLDDPYIHYYDYSGLFMNGAIRAFCGLCFGVVAYNIYIYIYIYGPTTQITCTEKNFIYFCGNDHLYSGRIFWNCAAKLGLRYVSVNAAFSRSRRNYVQRRKLYCRIV